MAWLQRPGQGYQVNSLLSSPLAESRLPTESRRLLYSYLLPAFLSPLLALQNETPPKKTSMYIRKLKYLYYNSINDLDSFGKNNLYEGQFWIVWQH